MLFRELKKHLSEGIFHPAYLLTGDDSFVIKTASDMFKKQITDFPQMNISYFSETDSEQDILEACECMPIMDKARLVIVSEYKGGCEKILKYLQNPNKTTVLILTQNVLKDNISKIIPLVTVVDCKKMDDENLTRYVLRNAKAFGSSLDESAALMLINYCGHDLGRITKELEKLSYFKLGGAIEKSEIENYVTAETDYKIYELSDAVSKKDKAAAAKILKSLIEEKNAPVSLMGMIYSHFRRLLYCAISKNDENLASLLGVKEFAVKKAIQESAKYTPLKLKKICDGFHNADYSFKAGLIGDELALETYVMQILS